MIGQIFLQYPPPKQEADNTLGLYPVDFLLETILKAGLEWFRTDPKAPYEVFGHLKSDFLNGKYGEAKIIEIANYIKKYDIKVVQHWSLIDQNYPSITVQLLDGSEMTERAGLTDFQGQIDIRDAENNILGRTGLGYTPMTDSMHIGIHAINTPDLVKYIYYLVVYVLSAFKPELEARGLQLGTFRATDVSRLNDYLPENMYSRFINFTVFTIASFSKGSVPIIEKIMGVHVAHGPDSGIAGVDSGGNTVAACSDEDIESVALNSETGVTLCTIQDEETGG